MSAEMETKTIQQTLAQKSLWTVGTAAFPDNVIALGPNSGTLMISQGTGQGARIANKIQTTSLKFTAIISPTNYSSSTNPDPRPAIVRMVILYDREDPNAVPVPGSLFFQDGNTSTGFTGTLPDTIRPINADRYRVLMTKDYKLGFSQYAGTTGDAAGQGAYQAWSNNDFKMNHVIKMNLTKFYPKRVRFNDNLTEPTSRGLYAFFYYVPADGTAYTAEDAIVRVSYMQDYRYKDA